MQSTIILAVDGVPNPRCIVTYGVGLAPCHDKKHRTLHAPEFLSSLIAFFEPDANP